MVLPDLVAEAVSANLAAVDSATPGLVEGLYLTGSVAMDDFQRSRSRSRWVPSGAGTSDIDLVAVTGHLPDLTAVQALTVMHRQLGARRPGPAIDCLYLTWSDLDCDPAEVSGRVQSHAGTVTTEGDGHPVLWHELAQQARRCAARVATSWRSGPNRDRLVGWVRGNLDGYWRRRHGQSSQLLSRAGLAGLTHWGPTWGVLGVARMHYTISTGRICSKSAGGQYARDEFGPRWHRVIEECLRIRNGGPGRSRYASPLTRRRDALDFVETVIADGVRP